MDADLRQSRLLVITWNPRWKLPTFSSIAGIPGQCSIITVISIVKNSTSRHKNKFRRRKKEILGEGKLGIPFE